MAAYNKFNQFIEDVMHGVHDFSADQLMVALVAAANPPVAGNSVLADLTQIAYTNLSSRALTISAEGQVGGTYEITIADLTLTSTGGSTGPFRYVVIYNDTPTAPADPLIAWFDYGADITLLDGESIDLDFDDVNGLFQAS